MNRMRKNSIFLACSLALTAFTSPTWAAFSWSFIGSGNPCANTGCVEDSTFNGDTVTATATGWTTTTTNVNSALTSAYQLKEWDGLSVLSSNLETSPPQHATDNNGQLESVMFAFSQDIVLNDITMGWHYDADFSLLRYIGAGTPTLTGDNYSNLTSSGSWELIDNYLYGGCQSNCSGSDKSVSTDYSNAPLNPNNKSSSYWLVAALNGAYFGDSGYIGNDYFKIKNLAGSCFNNNCGPNVPSGISEPTTLALMSFGIVGFGFTRLRRQQRIVEAK